jgi:hypothetical protein
LPSISWSASWSCCFKIHIQYSFGNSMKMEQTECSETLAFKLQTPGNHPEESIRHSEHGESLKSRMFLLTYVIL